MTKATFTTTILKDAEINATGIQVPPDVIAQLGKGKKPPVKVTIKGFTYRSTVAAYGDVFMLPLSQERRAAAGVQPGDTLEITLELDEEPRTVDVPDDLAAALAQKEGARAAFDKLPYSARKEFVRQVTEAKAQETRERRIAGIVAKMGGK
jgi:hypothetical protein